MKRKFYLFLPVFLLTSVGLIAQEVSFKFGCIAEYGVMAPEIDAFVSDKYHIYSTGSTLDGFRLGVFGQFQARKGFWHSELSYFQNRSFIQFVNLKPEEEPQGNVWLVGSGMYFNNMIKASLNRGFFVTKNFTIDAGLVTSLQLKDKYLSGKPDSYFNSDPWLTSSKIVYKFADGFNQFLLSGNVRVSYLFGPLNVYVSFEKSLTSVSKGVEYKGSIYPLHYGIKVWSFGVTYTILQSKK